MKARRLFPMEEATVLSHEYKHTALGRVTAFFVYLFDQVMPDPYVFAVILTFVAALLAYAFAPNARPQQIAAAWYSGVFNLFTFAFQMVIMLVAGYALASAPAIRTLLGRIASIPSNPAAAVSLTIVVSMIASWINWGLGLVTAALLAREIAKRIRLAFG